MKLHKILLLIGLTMLVNLPADAQQTVAKTKSKTISNGKTTMKSSTYNALWKEVEAFQEKDLPRSADETAWKIYRKAMQEENFAQLMKSGLTLAAMRAQISADSLTGDVARIEALPVRNEAESALKHLLVSSMYEQMNRSRQARSDQETQQLFAAKQSDYLSLSVAHLDQLAGVSSEPYLPLLRKGADSHLYRNDVLSLVVSFIADNGLQVKKKERSDEEKVWLVNLYLQAADIYHSKGMRDAAVLMQLESLVRQRYVDSRSLSIKESNQMKRLKSLYEANTDIEAGADVCLAYMDRWQEANWSERLDLAQWAQQTWPKSKLKGAFATKVLECLQPELSLTVSPKVLANVPFDVYVRHRNVASASLKIGAWNKNLTFDGYRKGQAEESMTDTVKVELQPGHYRMTLTGDGGRKDTCALHVTSLKVVVMNLPPSNRVVTVLDAQSGKPVVKCEVVGTWRARVGREWKSQTKRYTTDERGQVVIDENITEVVARKSATDVSEPCYCYVNGRIFVQSDEKETAHYQLFTDRAIYRPGQQLHVSGMAYRQVGDETSALSDFRSEVILRDANGKEVGRQEVITDEFGTIACDFMLPKGCLNGVFSLRFGTTSTTIRVEEYKRPTFDVTMGSFMKNGSADASDIFSLGDSVEIEAVAKTYSGVPVQGAQVKYHIEQRKASFWRWWGGQSAWESQDSGEAETDEEGRFRVKVFLDDDMMTTEDDEVQRGRGIAYLFRVVADVTDLAGESHSVEKTLRVSPVDFALSIELGSQIEKGELKGKAAQAQVKALNVEGQPVFAEGTYVLKCVAGDQVVLSEGRFSTESPVSLGQILKNATLGTYRLELKAHDSKGHQVEAQHDFVFWSKKGGTILLEKDWMYAPVTTISEKDGVDLWYATAHADSYTYLYIASQKSVVKRKVEMRGARLEHLHIDYRPEYADGVAVFFAYVKEGELHSQIKRFTLAEPEKKLSLSWTTFRDKLQPGQQETWTLQVVDKNGQPVPAQVMATMYDASLDAFAQLSWPFSVDFRRMSPTIRTTSSHLAGGEGIWVGFPQKYPQWSARDFSSLNSFDSYGYSPYSIGGPLMAMGGATRMMKNAAVATDVAFAPAMAMQEEAAEMEDNGEQTTDNGGQKTDDEKQTTDNGQQQPLRENFNETAFFYPRLMTDQDGKVAISFTMPESLTEWRFMGLAHTAQIDYGQIEGKIVIRKDLMVQPNIPRFVRMGDKVSIATRIINQSEANVEGSATLRLIDPATGEIVHTDHVAFQVEAERTTAVSFAYQVPEQYSMLICEIQAGNASFSDGERNWLPVLTDKKWLTETVPFFLDHEQSKEIDLSSLFNHQSETTTQRHLTFDYTANPSWLAVMSLHTVINPESDNAIDWSAALYANIVARHLASRIPGLQQLIRQWQAESSDETTLQSELEKNQQLKEILLRETPWMLDADDETQQRQRLCELFDENLLNERIEQARQKLAKLQFSDGAWAWFDGMQPNPYVTLCVSEHLAMLSAYLKANHVDDAQLDQMLKLGLDCVGRYEVEQYKKYYKKYRSTLPAESSLRWMYAATISGHKMKTDAAAVKTDYLNRVQNRIRQLSIYGRAHVAVILQAEHRPRQASAFIRSIAEHTVFKEGLGRYFDTEKAAYSWMDYKIPTHVAAMKTMMTTTDNFVPHGFPARETIVNEMLLWLLRQKQAQKWDNVINTIRAVDLLLAISPASLNVHAEAPVLVADGKTVSFDDVPSAGVGHIQQTLSPLIHSLNVSSSQLSWGCLYAQCLERIDRVQPSEGSLTVNRKYYVEKAVDNGVEWVELNPSDSLRVGQRIRIRHIVSADRDMDFVQMRAQFAAGLQPIRQLSGRQWLGGRPAYLSLHDASADLFFDTFRKGSATLDIDLYVVHAGHYTPGIATVQCAYAPDFSGHSGSGSPIVIR